MKILFKFLSILFICFLFTNILNATVFTSVKAGDFDKPETWNVGGGQIPGELDNVIIKHEIDLDLTSKITIKSLSISNNANAKSGIDITGTDSLIVLDNVDATAYNINKEVYLWVGESATLIIEGDCHFLRVTGNVSNEYFDFSAVNNGKIFIKGFFKFDYNGSGSGENAKEIILRNNGLLDVTGKSVFTNSAGEDFNLGLYDDAEAIFRDSLALILSGTGAEAGITLHNASSLHILSNAYILNSSTASNDFAKLRVREHSSKLFIEGNIYLESQGAKVKLEAEGANGEIIIEGDIVMDASAQEEAFINIIEHGEIYLGGDIIRNTPFGNLTMQGESALVFNGSDPQTIPTSKLSGSGTDSLAFRKIILENTSSQPFVLTENFIVQDSLILKNGNIITDETAMIILEDGALVSGSSTSYVEGPFRKMGTTAGQDLSIPIGTSAAYAPITISEITDVSSDVTVQYYGEPPPFGMEAFEAGIDNISDDGYWIVEKNASTGDLDITLTWADSNEAGVTEINDIVVVGWNGTEWMNHGQESSGVVDSGGFVTSLYSEPPPFGMEAFMIGSISSSNALPVELSKFEAVPESDRVYLKWETESEVNSSHFIVERSIDGIDFKEIESVNSKGGVGTAARYFVKDASPFHGLNYYRLKMFDNDDTYEYSAVVVVYLKDGVSTLVYPNPVRDMLTIQVEEWIDEEVRIEIFDMNANQIFEDMLYFESGEFQVPTNNVNVSFAGTYIIRISGKRGSKIVKFVKID